MQITTMTKHSITKLSDIYMSEVVEDVMKTMAGFPKHEQWYVGCCYADKPIVDYIKSLFPNIEN
eukprot:598462-Ditylum_brightwellii.AAC.1